jgi:hypothetical protein
MIKHMKVALATAALAFSASSANALEDQLSKLDQSIVVNMIGGVIVITSVAVTSIRKASERLGVDGDRLLAAIMAAVNVTNDLPYDRSALIPKVTRLVRDAADELSSALPQQCGKWAKTLIDTGVIEQK